MDDPVDGDRDRDEESSGGDADLDPTERDGEDAAQDAADSSAVPDENGDDREGESERQVADEGEREDRSAGEDTEDGETEDVEDEEPGRAEDTEDESESRSADDETEGESEDEEGEDEVEFASPGDYPTDVEPQGGSEEPAPDEADESESPTIDEEVVVDPEEGAPPAGDAVETGLEAEEPTAVERKGGGPPADQEQPLAEHIEEMVKRLAIVVVVAGAVSLAVFPYGEEIINFLWYSILPGSDVAKPHLYHPLELLLTQLKVASLAGLIIALPVFVYETYAFMRPGLYPHERRYYIAAIPTSLILAFVGVLFAYFIVLPAVMSYFLTYSQDVVNIAFALGKTFDLILVLMGYLALVFQIPLFIMLAIMMGLTTRTWMEDRRLIFWGVFAGISFLFSPDPTGMAPAIIALTMIALFEGTLLLLRWTGR